MYPNKDDYYIASLLFFENLLRLLKDVKSKNAAFSKIRWKCENMPSMDISSFCFFQGLFSNVASSLTQPHLPKSAL